MGGALVASVCTSAICCAGHGLCACLCCGCRRCGLKRKSQPRVAYLVFQLSMMLTAFSLMYLLSPDTDEADANPDYLACIEGLDPAATPAADPTEISAVEGIGQSCYSQSALPRMTFTLLVFHVIIFLAVLPGNCGTCTSLIHDGGWALKLILVLAVFAASFWIPISFFQGWVWFSQYASALFWVF